MKTIRLECQKCGEPFDKNLSEYKRCCKRGQQRFYCGLSCHMSVANKTTPRGQDNWRQLDPANRRDEFTPFRWFLLRAKARRAKKGPTNLTLKSLQSLWSDQEGVCPLTGWALTLPDGAKGWLGGKSPRNASLDRLDHRKGYIKGNVRFVALMANVARKDFSDEELVAFCRAVASIPRPPARSLKYDGKRVRQ